ncbi:flagellar hook-length control protein FliK [Aliiglaciecola aliphaticivorans]
MQDIATTKSEIAALMTKVNDYSGNNISQQLEFRSYLKQADKVYGQPDEPRKNHIAQENSKASEDTLKQALTEKKKDNSREYAKPVEQKSAAQTPETTTDDSSETSAGKKTLDPVSQELNKTTNADVEKVASKHIQKEQGGELQSSKEELARGTSEHSINDEKAFTTGEEQTNELLNTVNSGNVGESEEGLNDWLLLLEKSIAKASNTSEQLPNEKGDIEVSETHNITGEQVESDGELDSELTLFELLSQNENIELLDESAVQETSTVNTDVETDSPESIAHSVHPQTESTVDTEASSEVASELANSLTTEQEAELALHTLSTLITELQAAESTSEQNTDTTEVQSADELITRISEFLEQLDPEVIESLRERLTHETESVALVNNVHPVEDSETENAVIEDMQLLLGLLNVANDQSGKSTNADNSEMHQQDGNPSLNAQAQVNAVTGEQEIPLSTKPLDKSLAVLLDIPADKLDAALTNLAKRLDIKPATSQVDTSQATLKTDFVSALKSGIEEVKAQLQQGHQPAIDLSALVSDAATKVNAMPIVPEVLDHSVTRFNQSLELTSQLNAKIEQLQHNFASERNLVKENVNQAQHLQTKQGQQMAQFDKAVNITRNEGLQQLTEKVRWMANQNNLQAEIRLDPPDLGAMKVRLNMSGDTASVNIVVQSQQARDVLEQATPRLKELLEQQGIELGQSSVQQENSNDTQQDSEYVGTNQADENIPGEETQVIEQRISNGRLGGIDYFV